MNKRQAKSQAKVKATGGTLLPGAGRAKIHDDNTKLKKRDRQQWRQKLNQGVHE